MRRLRLAAFAALAVFGASCELVTPTNPFDPETPPDQQELGSLTGTVVLENPTATPEGLAIELAAIRVELIDSDGRRLLKDGEAVRRELVDVTGDRGNFTFDGVVPGFYTVVVDGVSSFYRTPVIVPVEVLPGAAATVADLVFRFDGEDGCGPGSISGTVDADGDAAGQRNVSLFVRGGDGVRFVDAEVSSDGSFDFPCLATGTYALVAESAGFTPDHRIDISVGEGDGALLAQTFDGDESLRLFPVTAVMLPLAGPNVRISDGTAFVAGSDVPLAVLAFGGVTHMRLGTDPDFDNDGVGVDFEPFAASKAVALPDIEGTIPVFAQFEIRSAVDGSPFIFTSEVYATSVVRDVSSPTVLSVALPGVDQNDGLFVAKDGALQIVIEAQDLVSAVDGYSIDVDGVGGDAIQDISSGSARLQIQVAQNLVVDGEHVIQVRLRDKAGNLSLVGPGATVRVLLDSVEPDVAVVVDNADNGVLRERRAVLSFTDRGGDADTMRIDLVRGNGDVEELVGDSPFVDRVALSLPSPNHLEAITLRTIISDRVGNTAEVNTPQLDLSFLSRVVGSVSVDGVPNVVADHAGVTVNVVNGAGAVLGSAVTAADGSFAVADLVEASSATVEASLAGWLTARRGVGALTALAQTSPAVDADRLDLRLATGTLAVNARRDAAASDDTAHAGIVVRVRLSGSLRSFERVLVTGDDGSALFTDVPATLAGEVYTVTASLDRHQPVTTTTNLVAGTVTQVGNLRLSEVSGAFDVCPGSSGPCDISSFANTDDVRVRLRGVVATALRARAGNPILTTTSTAELPFQPIGNAGADVVDISGLADGIVPIFLQFQTGIDTTSDVLVATITKDTVAPSAPAITLQVAAGARAPGFTRFDNVDIVVNGDAGSGNVAPLARARVVVADTAPATAPAIAGSCDDDAVCTIALPTVAGAVVEKLHRVHAFACDEAGNCGPAASTAVVHDRTPPSLGNGAGFSVTDTDTGADTVVAGTLLLRSPLYVATIATGAARTAGGAAVLSSVGSPVADVFAYRLSFVASGSDVPTRDLSPGAAPTANTNRTDVVTPALPAIEDEQTVFASLVDAAGNELATPIARTLRIDTQAPVAGFALAAPDGNVVATTSAQVRLLVTPTGEAPARIELDLDNDGAFDDADVAFPFVAGEDVQTLPLGGDGPVVVGARFVDALGNAAVRTATILVDRAAPDVVVVTCATCTTVGGALFSAAGNAQETLNIVSNDGAGSGAQAISITVNGGAPTVTQSPTTATVALVANTTNTVVVRSIDRAGNVSSTAQARSLTIVHDTAKPTFTVVVAGGAAVVRDPDVSVVVQNASADVVGMRLSSTSTFAGPVLPFNPATSFSLPFPDALRTVFVELRDAAGNTEVQSDDTRLDTVAPNGAVNVAAAVGGFVNTANLTVNASLDGATRFALGVEPFVCPLSLPAVPSLPVSLGPLADGTVTLVGCFGDDAGNVSQNRLGITIDTVAPAAVVSVDAGASFSLDTTVDVVVSDAADVVAAFFAEGAVNCATATLAAFNPASTPVLALAAGGPEGARTVTGCFADRAGNRSQSTDTIVVDRVDPTGSVVIANGANFVRGVPGRPGDPVDVNVGLVGVAGDVGTVALGIPDLNCATATYQPFAPVLRATLNVDGTNTVAVCLKDFAGRTTKATDTVVLDRIAPLGTVSLNGGAASVTTLSVSALFTADADVTSAALVGGDADCETLNAALFTPVPPLTRTVVLLGGGPQTATACFRDDADNRRRSSDNIDVDLSALNQVEVIANNGADFSRLDDVPLTVLAPPDATGFKIVIDQSNVDANANNIVDVCESGVFTEPFNAAPTALNLTDGLRTIGVCVETPTRTLYSEDQITVDTVLPVGTLVIAGNAARTRSDLVLVDLTFSGDVDSVAVTNAPSIDCANTSYEPALAAKTVALPGPDTEAANVIRGCLRDRAGNTTLVSDSIIFDKLPPQGVSSTLLDLTSAPLPNAGFVHKTAVTARLALGVGTTQVAVAEGLVDCNAATFVNASGATLDVAITLSTGDATKSVGACFRDVVGNVTATTASVVLDTSAPLGRVLLNNGALTTTTRSISVALDAPGDVHLAAIVEAATLNCQTASYQALVPNGSFALTGAEGDRTLAVCFKDDSGRTALTTDSIRLDLTRPSGSLTLVGSGQPGFTAQTQIAANMGSGDAVEMALATSVIDCDSVAYSAFAPSATLTLPAGDGSKTVFLCLRDVAGNVSTLTNATITLDQTPPAAAAHTVAINGAGLFTTSTTATLTVAFAADAVERAIANDGLDCSSTAYVALPATSPLTVSGHALSSGDGQKVVAVCFRDRAGNTTLATDSITLDTVAPSTLDTFITINAGAARTSSTTLSVAVNVPNDVDGIAYQEGALSQAACDAQNTFEVPASPKVFVLASSTEGQKTLSACVRERAGRRIVVSDSIFLDPTRPLLTSVTLDGSTSGGSTRDRVVDVVIVGASADTVAFAVADADIADCAAAAYVPFVASFSRALVGGDGTKTVSVCLRDETGNVSATSTEATIALDTAAPAGAAVAVAATTTTSAVTVTLSYSGSGIGAATAAAIADGAIDCSTAARTALDGTSPDTRALTLVGADGSHSIVGCFYDDAGNFTAVAPATTFLDTRAPVVSSVTCANCSTDGGTLFSTSTTVNLAASSDESGSGVSGNALVSVDGVEASRAFSSGTVAVTGLSAGIHTLRVRLVDNAGNTTSIADAKTLIVTVDNVAPALAVNSDFRINGANSGTFTSSATVAVTVNNPPVDATQMAIAEGALTCATASYVPLVTAFSFNLTGVAQTLRTLQLCLKDRAGNVTATAQTASTTFDTAPPALPGSNVVVIDDADADNNHDPFLTTTAGLRIILDWNTAGDVVAFKVSEGFADCTEPMERPVNIATIDTFTKTDLVLSPVDGNKIVFACFKDAAGNTITSSNSSVLDQVGANGAVSVNGGAAFTTDVGENVSITLRMGTDTARFALTETANAACTTPTLACGSASFVNVSGAVVVDGVLQQTVTQNLLGNPAAQGGKCFEACFEDAAGNRTASASLDGITFDTVAPAASASLTGLSLTAGLTRSPFVTLTLTGAAADTAQMRVSEDSGFVGGTVAFEGFTATRAIALSPNDGAKQVNVQLRDTAGNVSSLAISAAITLDTQAPAAPAVVINSGVSATSSTTVSLSVQATGATQRLIVTPDNPADVEAFAAFPISPATLGGVVIENGVLGADDGQKAVLVVFRDDAGNEATAVDTIELDRAGPAAALVTCGAGTATGVCINNGALATNSVTASLSFAATGATEMSIATDGCADGEADEPFVAFSTAIQALLDGSTQGTKTIAVRFRDDAGNTSQTFVNCATTPGHLRTITFDTVAPSGVLVALTSTAATDPAGFSTTAAADGTFTRGDATSFKHGQAVDCSTAAGYAAIAGASATVTNIALAGGNGLKPYFACFKDDAGNVTSATTSITVDNQVPVGTLVLANGINLIGSVNTTATLTFSSDVTGILVQNAALGTCPTGAGSYSPATPTVTHTLTAGTGSKTVSACLRDAAGNVSSVLTDAIDVDVTPPTLTTFTVNGSAGAITTNSTTVNLVVDATDTNGPVTMALSNTPLSCATASYTTLSATLQHQIPVAASTTINLCLKDGLGVTSVSPTTRLVNLDQAGPAGAVEVRLSAATASELVNTTGVVVRVSGVVEAGVTRKVANDVVDCSVGAFTAIGLGSTDIAHVLSSADGTKSVFVCLKDSVGNVSLLSDTLTLDTTAPTGITLALDNGAAVSLDTTVTANFSGVVDVVQARLSTTDPGTCPTVSVGNGYGAFVNGANQTVVQGANTVFACLADAAGNTVKVSDSVDVDTTDPSVTFNLGRRGTPSPDATFTNTREVTLKVTAASVVAGSSISLANAASLACANAATPYTPLPNPLPTLPFNIDFELAAGGADDLRSVTLCVKEPSGRTNGASGTTATINLDTTPPSVAVSINTGASVTATDTVSLGFSPSPSNDPLRFITSRVPTEDCAAAAYSGTFATVTGSGSFTLLNGAGLDDSGTKFAVGCFQDRAGNTFAGIDDIFFDEDRPNFASRPICTGCNLVDATASAAGTFGDDYLGFTNQTSTVAFDTPSLAGDLAFVLAMVTTDTDQSQANGLGEDRVCVTSATCNVGLGETCELFPVKDSSGLTQLRCVLVSTPDAVTAPLFAADGKQAIIVALEDTAGNLSNGRNIFVVRDTLAPVITWSLNVAGIINQSTVFVRSLKTTGEPVIADVTRVGEFQASSLSTFADAATLPYTEAQISDAFPVTLSSGDGLKTVAIRFVDNAGNENVPASSAVSVILDTTKPTDPRFNNSAQSINGTGSVAINALAIQSTDTNLRSPRPYNVVGFPVTGGVPECSGITNIVLNATTNNCEWNGVSSFTLVNSKFIEGENRYRVLAVDTAGNVSNEDFVLLTKDSVVPLAPTNPRVSERSGSVTFAWSPSTSADVAGYLVEYGYDDGGPTTLDPGLFAAEGPSPVFVPPAQTQITLTGLTDDTPIEIRVFAVDEVSNPSAKTATVAALPNPVAPASLSVLTRAAVTAPSDAIIARGPRVYAKRNNLMCTYDTSNPLAMVETNCATLQAGDRLKQFGRFLYVTNDNAAQALRRIDISTTTPSAPTAIDLGVNDNVEDIAFIGRSAIGLRNTGASTGELVVLQQPNSAAASVSGDWTPVQNISTLDNAGVLPNFAGVVDLVDANTDVGVIASAFFGTIVVSPFVVNAAGTVASIGDFNNNTGPVPPGFPRALKLDGRRIYIGSSEGLFIGDINTPGVVGNTVNVNFRGNASGFECGSLDVVGGYAFCTDSSAGTSSRVIVIDVADPAQPRLVGRSLLVGGLGFIAIDVEENLIYGTRTDGALEVLQLWTPTRFAANGSNGIDPEFDAVYDGNTVMATATGLSGFSSTTRINTFNISDRDSPLKLQTVDDDNSSGIPRITLSGKTAYTVTSGGSRAMRVHDVYANRSILQLNRVTIAACPRVDDGVVSRDITAYGNYAVIASSGGTVEVWAINTRNGGLFSVSCIGEVSVPNVSRLSEVVDNQIATFSTDGVMRVVSLATLSAPSVVRTLSGLGSDADGFGGIELRGSSVFVGQAGTGNTGSLRKLDITPVTPTISNTISRSVGGIALAGGTVIGAIGTRINIPAGASDVPSLVSGLLFLDPVGPSTFAIRGQTLAVVAPWRALVAGPTVIAVSDGNGLQLMTVSR